MTQNDIRQYLDSNTSVLTQVASAESGNPEISWGDSFFYVLNSDGSPSKMPFATIITKDYDGFDINSKLNRGGLFRLNIEVGKEKFEEIFGIATAQIKENLFLFDVASIDSFFPHPVYGAYGWISIINPSNESANTIKNLLTYAINKARKKPTR